MDQNDHHATENPRPLTEEERREFLRRARTLAVGAPATALLLQAASRPARAQGYGVGPTRPTTGTDTTRPMTTIDAPSDRRLKADIRREGTLPNGIGVYSFRYTWSDERFVGVMADEVAAVIPAAVSVHASGYRMVDYARLLG